MPYHLRKNAFNWPLRLTLALIVAGHLATTPAAAQPNWFADGLDALNQSRYDTAIEAFTHALEIVPDDYEAYNNRGIAYAKKGLMKEAEADFDRAIERNPDYADAYVNRGIERQKQGYIDSALVDYHQAMTLTEGNSPAQLLLAWSLATWPDERFRDGPLAVKLAGGLIDPAASDAPWDLLAAAYAEAGQFDQAIEAQNKYIDQLARTDAPPEEVEAYRRRLVDFKARKPLRNWVMDTQPIDDAQAAMTMAMLKQSLGGMPTKPAVKMPVGGAPAKPVVKKPVAGTLVKKAPPAPSVDVAGTLAKKAPPAPSVEAAAHEEPPPAQSAGEPTPPSAADTPKASEGQAFPYVLTIATMRDEKLGFETTRRFFDKGDPAFSSWIYTSASGNWYQIYIGWFADLESARQAAAQLETRKFREVIVNHAPLAVMVGDVADGDDLDALEAQLDTLGIIGYRIGGRLLIGAYKVKLAAQPLTERLEAAGIAYQWVSR